MSLGNIKFFRLLVVLLFIIIPVYFFSIFLFVDVQSSGALFLSWFLAYLDRNFVFYFLMPLVLSVPWFIFLIVFRNNFAESFQIMHDTKSVITPRWTLFFGLNSILIVALFIMPVIANILSFFGFFVLSWRIFISSDWAEKKGSGANTCWFFIVVILLEIFPFLVAWEGYWNYSILQNVLWTTWIQYLPEFYSFLIVIFNAFTIGSLTRLIASKTSEFESDIDQTTETNLPKRLIYLVQTLFLVIFLVFWILELSFGGTFHWINLIINMICLLLAFILIILSLVRGRSAGIKLSIISYLIVFIFAIVYEVRVLMLASANNISAVFSIPSQTFIYWLTAMIAIPAAIYLIFWILCLIKSSGED
ncbi:MAG: hypothetical protein ACTSPY_05600 [Candidatus Helarchaeota archaeon]